MEKIVFLDRDGVINRNAPPHQYILNLQTFHVLPNTAEAVHLLNNNGYKIIVVSNQRCISLGMLTVSALNEIHDHLNRELAKHNAHIDAFYTCPHNIGECSCRKPQIGLFRQAEKQYNIDKGNSWMIGDNLTDIQAGIAYGVKSILIQPHDESAHLHSLLDTVNFILQYDNGVILDKEAVFFPKSDCEQPVFDFTEGYEFCSTS